MPFPDRCLLLPSDLDVILHSLCNILVAAAERYVHHAEQCWCHNTVLFDPILYIKRFKEFSIILHTCLHVILKLPHHCYESGWTAKLGHDFPEFINTNCVKSFGEVDKHHVYRFRYRCIGSGIQPRSVILFQALALAEFDCKLVKHCVVTLEGIAPVRTRHFN